MKDIMSKLDILCIVVRENYATWLKHFVHWGNQIWGSLKIV